MKTSTLRVGSREIAVDQSPVRVGVRSIGQIAVTRPRTDCLVIAYPRGERIFGWCCGIVGFIFLPLGLLGLVEHAAAGLLVAFGGMMLYVWVSCVGPSYRFDTADGHLTVRHFWRTRRRPLGEIVAVQVIDGGKFQGKRGEYTSYQLNLILDDSSESRQFVAFNANLADLESKAKLLAEFLRVPLLAVTQRADKPQEPSEPVAAPPTTFRPDPTRYWAKSYDPLPVFDQESAALGSLKLGDSLEQAEFLGRPDRVEHLQHLKHPGAIELHYLARGFRLGFLPEFVELTCLIAPRPDGPPERGQGYCRPRLSGDIEFTPETTVADVCELFGPPKSEYDYPREKTLVYCYHLGSFAMEFEFELATGKLLTWSVPA